MICKPCTGSDRARCHGARQLSIKSEPFLIEQGITVRKGLRALKNSFQTDLEERKDEISPRMRKTLIGLYGDWLWVDDRIDTVSSEIEDISRTEENCVNVMTIPPLGHANMPCGQWEIDPMISTAMVAAIGTGDAFDRGRDFAAWVDLVPRQYSWVGERFWGGSPNEAVDICACCLCKPPR